jgi:DNA polymerase III subunit alpha
MGITNIDPIHHGLLFERFLNPERKSMPDIDTDFCIERRDEVIEYVTRRYGEEQGGPDHHLQPHDLQGGAQGRGAGARYPLRRVRPDGEADPRGAGQAHQAQGDDLRRHPRPRNSKKSTTTTPKARRWIDMALRIEGTNKTFGMHAAGVVISKDPLDEIVPLQRNNDGQVITQYYMEDVEALGLLKMDFLGLRNLTMIQKTLDLVKPPTASKSTPTTCPWMTPPPTSC